MATVMSPVELPTGRRSYYHNPRPRPDIYDPNWIPILETGRTKAASSLSETDLSSFPLTTFSLFPSQARSGSNSPRPRQGISHNYSKSSLAPESVTPESRAQSTNDIVEPLPSRVNTYSQPVEVGQDEKHHHSPSTGAGSNEEQMTVDTRTSAEPVSAPSTEETASVVEEGDTSRQESSRLQREGLPTDSSTLSSSPPTSTRRITVHPPTSKYNRKPVASVTASVRPSLVPSYPQTAQESPRIGPTLPCQTFAFPRQPPAEPQAPEPAAQVYPSKSNASERRQRALNSHPSDLSLRGHSTPSPDDVEVVAQPPPARAKSRKSTDSRPTTSRSIIYDSQVPTPAPTTPLPELPPEARRPPTRENGSQRQTRALPDRLVPAPNSHLGPSEHAGLASFMVERNTIVFRRFDDVHVRLLLCLQDEISQLERELLNLESQTSSDSPAERILQKGRILRELRKLVGEYDQMFTTWSRMQAKKVNETTTRELKQWLERPGTSAGAGLGISIQQDLLWLEESKDLSSIGLNEKDLSAPGQKASSGSVGTGNGSGGNAGWMSWFKCAGKRK